MTDGIAMGHQGMKSSLVSREVIADSIELTMRGHCYDAMVGLAGCDKSLPGVMMAMLRLNVPAVFMYGGSILPGKFHGKDVTVVDVFEGVGQHSAGNMSDEELHALECVACPGAGACGGQFTANTMAMVSEAIGLALPASAGAPAPYESRDEYALASGKAVMRLVADGIRPRDICTRKAFENAATIVAATGGSTNGGLHLPAMAHECGIEFDMMEVCAIFKKTPYIADLKPGGKYVAKDVYDIGGVPQVMRALLDGGYLHEDCLTVTGKTIKQNLENVKFNENQKVVYPVSNPISATGGVVGLQGTLAPDGAIVKVAGMTKLQFRGPARVFDCEEDCFQAVQNRDYKDGDVLVIRYEGPKGGPGHARDVVDHGRALWPGREGQGRPHHGRALLWRYARILHRSHRARGRGRRTDRAARGRRHDRHRCRERHTRCGTERGGAHKTPQGLESATESLSKRRIEEVCGPGGASAQGRGYACRRRQGSCLLCGYIAGWWRHSFSRRWRERLRRPEA